MVSILTMATQVQTATEQLQKLQLRGETSIDYEREKVCRRSNNVIFELFTDTIDSTNMKATFPTFHLALNRLSRSSSMLMSG